MANFAIVIGDTPEHVAAKAKGLGGHVQIADIKAFDTLSTEYTHFGPFGDIDTDTAGYIWVGLVA